MFSFPISTAAQVMFWLAVANCFWAMWLPYSVGTFLAVAVSLFNWFACYLCVKRSLLLDEDQ